MFFSSVKVISQNTDAELFFNDGTSIIGYGMIDDFDRIMFRVSLDDKPDVWTELMVKKIIFYGFEMSIEFQYVKLKPDRPPLLLEVLVDEETKLFSDTKTHYLTQNPNPNPNYNSNNLNKINNPKYNPHPINEIFDNEYMNIAYGEYKTSKIYVQKAQDEFAFPLTGNFRKKAKDYFSDCEVLVSKIDSGEFRKSTAKEMVYYYNNYCLE